MKTKIMAFAMLITLFLFSEAAHADEHLPLQGGFTNSSLHGSYAVVAGTATVGVVGVCQLDGLGAFGCNFTTNAPGEGDERDVYNSNSEGEYSVNPDGTGTVHETEMFSDGTTNEYDHDFVVTAAEAIGPYVVATEIHTLIRQALDPSGMVLSAKLTRLPDTTGAAMASPAMSAQEDNIARVRAFYDEFNQGNVDAVADLYAADAVYHGTQSMTLEGATALTEYVSGFRAAFPDLEVAIEEIIAQGDLVAIRFRGVGTHEGTLGEIAATGNSIDVPGLTIMRLENGQVVEEWELFDEIGMMQQLGVMPAPGQ